MAKKKSMVRRGQSPQKKISFSEWVRAQLEYRSEADNLITPQVQRLIEGMCANLISLYNRPAQPLEGLVIAQHLAIDLKHKSEVNFKQAPNVIRALLIRALRKEPSIVNEAMEMKRVLKIANALSTLSSKDHGFYNAELDPTRHFVSVKVKDPEGELAGDDRLIEAVDREFVTLLIDRVPDALKSSCERIKTVVSERLTELARTEELDAETKPFEVVDLKALHWDLCGICSRLLDPANLGGQLREELIDLLGNILRRLRLRSEASRYHQTFIPKRSGHGARKILEPIPALRLFQDCIKAMFEHLLPTPHSASYGFVYGRNAKDHAQLHVGSRALLTLDISSFFDSIDIEPLYEKLKESEAAGQLRSSLNIAAHYQALWLSTTSLATRWRPEEGYGGCQATRLTYTATIAHHLLPLKMRGSLISKTHCTEEGQLTPEVWRSIRSDESLAELSDGRCFLIWTIACLRGGARSCRDLLSWKGEYFTLLSYLLSNTSKLESLPARLAARVREVDAWVIEEDDLNESFHRAEGLLRRLSRRRVINEALRQLGLSRLQKLTIQDLDHVYHLIILSRYGGPAAHWRRFSVSRTLPQGSPVSPLLSNFYMASLDEELEALARQYQLKYSRYADDLAFSGDVIPRRFINMVNRKLNQSGLRINRRKVRLANRGQRQEVTGVIVNHKTGPARFPRDKIRALIHTIEAGGIPHLNLDGVKAPLSPDQALGHLGYWRNLDSTLVSSELLSRISHGELTWNVEQSS